MYTAASKVIHLASCIAICALELASPSASAEDILGAYIGVAAGQSTIYNHQTAISNFDEHHGAWAIRAGIKPIPLVGAELEYTAFGKPSAHSGSNLVSSDTTIEAASTSIAGILYVPTPVPLTNFMVKFGYSNLQQKISEVVSTQLVGVGTCPISNPGCAINTSVVDKRMTTSKLLYGIGVQSHLWRFLVRADYEKVGSQSFGADFLSLGASWKFD